MSAMNSSNNLKKGLSSTNTSFDRLKAQFTAVRKVKKQSLIKRLRESNTALVPGNSDISIHLVESKVQSGDDTQCIEGLTILNDVLIKYNQQDSGVELDKSSILRMLTYTISSNNNRVQLLTLWCMSNYASGDHYHTSQMIHFFPIYIDLLTSSDTSIQESVCWILGNIAGDCNDCCNSVKLSFLDKLLMILIEKLPFVDNGSINSLVKLKEVTAWAICNIIRGQHTTVSEILSKVALADLINLLDTNNFQLLNEIGWIFSFMSAKADAPIVEFLNCGMFEKLISIFQRIDCTNSIIVPFIITLNNVSPSLDQSKFKPVLDLIQNCLFNESDISVIKEILHLLINVCHISQLQISNIKQHCLLDNLVRLLQVSMFDVRKDSLLLIDFLFSDEVLPSRFVTIELMGELIDLLMQNDVDAKFSAFRIIRNLALSSSEYLTSFSSLGLLEVLDDIAYGPWENNLIVSCRQLADSLYENLEDIEMMEYDNQSNSGFNADASVPSNIFQFNSFQSDGKVLSFDNSNIDNRNNSQTTTCGTSGRGKHLTLPSWMK